MLFGTFIPETRWHHGVQWNLTDSRIGRESTHPWGVDIWGAKMSCSCCCNCSSANAWAKLVYRQQHPAAYVQADSANNRSRPLQLESQDGSDHDSWDVLLAWGRAKKGTTRNSACESFLPQDKASSQTGYCWDKPISARRFLREEFMKLLEASHKTKQQHQPFG